MADPAKAIAARAHQRGQNRLDTAAQHHIRVSNNAGGDPGFAKDAAVAHRRDAIGELNLADRPHFLGAPIAIHRTRLHVHRRNNIVTAAGIQQQVIQQIPPSRALPQMMVRIDDRQFRFENRLLAPVEPISGESGSMARLAVAHTRAVTKGPPHRREGWKIRVGSFDSPPLTNGIGELLYPTVDQDGEAIAGMAAILAARRLQFASSVRMARITSVMRSVALPPAVRIAGCHSGERRRERRQGRVHL